MSNYEIGDIVRIKGTKTSADGRVAVVVNPAEEACVVRVVSNTRIAVKDEQLEQMDESSIYEPGSGAYLSSLMEHGEEGPNKARAEAVAAVARRIEAKRRRGILVRLLAVFAVWAACGLASVVLWMVERWGVDGLSAWGLIVTGLGYVVTTPQMIGLICACADDLKTYASKSRGARRGGANGKKADVSENGDGRRIQRQPGSDL